MFFSSDVEGKLDKFMPCCTSKYVTNQFLTKSENTVLLSLTLTTWNASFDNVSLKYAYQSVPDVI